MTNDKALIKRQVARIIRVGTRSVAGTKRILPACPEILYSETVLLKRLTVPELHALADVMEFVIKRAKEVAVLALLLCAPVLGAQQQKLAMTGFGYDLAEAPVVASFKLLGEYEQLESYKALWKEAAVCVGTDLWTRAASVRFFYVNVRLFTPLPSQDSVSGAAVTYAKENQIYISAANLKDRNTIVHEMIHQLLYWEGFNDWADDGRPEFALCHVTLPELGVASGK